MFLLSSLFFCEFSFFGITKLERWGLLFLVFLFCFTAFLDSCPFLKSASSISLSYIPHFGFRSSLKGLCRNDIDIYYSSLPFPFLFPLFFFTCLGWFLHVIFFFLGEFPLFFLGGEVKRGIRKCVYVVLSFLLRIILSLSFSGGGVECQLSWDRKQVTTSC